VVAGLEIHVHRGTRRARAGIFQGKRFGVRLARLLVPALAYDGLALGDDAADARVGGGGE
jgi:hypothetical protein